MQSQVCTTHGMAAFNSLRKLRGSPVERNNVHHLILRGETDAELGLSPRGMTAKQHTETGISITP